VSLRRGRRDRPGGYAEYGVLPCELLSESPLVLMIQDDPMDDQGSRIESIKERRKCILSRIDSSTGVSIR
jgi:hypothetical protein